MNTKTKTALYLKAPKLFLATLLVAVTVSVMSFTPSVIGHQSQSSVIKLQSEVASGKAWWITYYITGKKLYITDAYNNDCYYCSNEINESFSKWLILNDYDNTPSKVNITSQYALSEADVEEKREKILLRYKGYGYSVIKVGFTYQEK